MKFQCNHDDEKYSYSSSMKKHWENVGGEKYSKLTRLVWKIISFQTFSVIRSKLGKNECYFVQFY